MRQASREKLPGVWGATLAIEEVVLSPTPSGNPEGVGLVSLYWEHPHQVRVSLFATSPIAGTPVMFVLNVGCGQAAYEDRRIIAAGDPPTMVDCVAQALTVTAKRTPGFLAGVAITASAQAADASAGLAAVDSRQ